MVIYVQENVHTQTGIMIKLIVKILADVMLSHGTMVQLNVAGMMVRGLKTGMMMTMVEQLNVV